LYFNYTFHGGNTQTTVFTSMHYAPFIEMIERLQSNSTHSNQSSHWRTNGILCYSYRNR